MHFRNSSLRTILVDGQPYVWVVVIGKNANTEAVDVDHHSLVDVIRKEGFMFGVKVVFDVKKIR